MVKKKKQSKSLELFHIVYMMVIVMVVAILAIIIPSSTFAVFFSGIIFGWIIRRSYKEIYKKK